MVSEWQGRRGAHDLGDGGAEFVLWAPSCGDIEIESVRVVADGLAGGGDGGLGLEAVDDGHWHLRARLDAETVRYHFAVSAREKSTGERYTRLVSDPYARAVGRDFRSILKRGPRPRARPGFVRPALRDLTVYELHVYNFTAEDRRVHGAVRGAYGGVIERLAYLVDLGVNAIELMPVFDYSDPWQIGIRWNYITACHLHAPHRGYAVDGDSAREEFIALVDACHARGVAVLIDAVFNQVSRRFSYARIYDPRHDPRNATDCSNSPLLGNFAGTDPNPGSEPYRDKDWGGVDLDYTRPAAQHFVEDVMHTWFDELGVDGMRFDHTLGFYRWKDNALGAGAVAAAAARIGGASSYRVAEHFSSFENELALVRDTDFNSCWAKGFYYAIDDALAGRGLAHLEHRMNPRAEGFSDDKPPTVFIDNHDDERLVNRGGSPWWRVQPCTIALMTHPGVPMLYMGCEYAEDDRTRYANGLPRELNPLDWEQSEAAGPLLRLHRAMGFLRRRLASLRGPLTVPLWRHEAERVLVYGRGDADLDVIVALNFSESPQTVRVPAPGEDRVWHEFLFNLGFASHGGEMHFHGADGHRYDRITVPGSYAHIYCRTRCWSDDDWRDLFARDRDPL